MNNIELLKRTISNLKAMYDINHEFMEESECTQLLEDIASLTKRVESLVYDETSSEQPTLLTRYGATWQDTFGETYNWYEPFECFISVDNYTYYMIDKRLNDDEVTVVLAQKKVIEPVYADSYDVTFLMEETLENGDIQSSEVVSWFHGKPTPELIAEWSENRSLKAVY